MDWKRIGRIAVEKKCITNKDLENLLEKQKELRDQGKEVLLGELMVNNDYLPEEQLKELLIIQKRKLDNYEIQGEIGRGGMGVIYKAFDANLARTVAIKMISPFINEKNVRKRFIQEAKSIAAINHPGIISIFKVYEEPVDYYVMEYVEGNTFNAYIQKNRPTIQELITIIIKIGKAISYAHECGIVHRDLKPTNIMMTKKNEPKVMDFGLAKVENSSVSLSKSGMVVGTVMYMSPEQAEGNSKNVDYRSDIYSLGTILYECLAHRLPFQGESMVDVITKISSERPMPPSKWNNAIAKDLDNICYKALEKKKEFRYQSTFDFVKDLEDFLSGKPIGANYTRIFLYWLRKHAYILAGVILSSLIMFLVYNADFSSPLDPHVVKQHNTTANEIVKKYPTDKGLLLLNDFPYISELNLSNSQISDEGIASISHLKYLEKLLLQNTNITDQSLLYISNMPSIKVIFLQNTKVTNNGMIYLQKLPRLELLNVDGTEIDDEGVKHIKDIDSLKRLALTNTKITDKAVSYLDGKVGLLELYFQNTNITDQGLQFLQGLTGLEYINLNSTKISDQGLKYIKDLNLNMLTLFNTNITNEGVEILANLKSLHLLEIGGTKITSEGIKYFIEMKNLENLSLRYNEIDDGCIKYIKKMGFLRWLAISETKISVEGREEIKKHLLSTTISW